jgi:hypothetical protein
MNNIIGGKGFDSLLITNNSKDQENKYREKIFL